MTGPAEPEVEEFHRVFTELVRKYQFRDRQGLACHGLSVSQCHALEVLGEGRPLRMGRLAARLHLSVSTMTRIVDQLVAKELARRWHDADDRRVCRVALSEQGEALYRVVRRAILAREREVLESLRPEEREALVEGLSQLSNAVDEWREREECARRDPKAR
jgi:DNA-binding MarR family transcriptional regulator